MYFLSPLYVGTFITTVSRILFSLLWKWGIWKNACHKYYVRSICSSVILLKRHHPPKAKINARACSSVNPCLAIVRWTSIPLRSTRPELQRPSALLFCMISEIFCSFGFCVTVFHGYSLFSSDIIFPSGLVVDGITHLFSRFLLQMLGGGESGNY